ncbi:uncharacterized protein LOC129944965 [Eupeodes corollae]|uniref:uncharacterized protein LOC129944965 n=1 Tax=Eupeodes corollae TaxID=290404 RepID=UPI002491356E|nr:uncharacterized protein LOC129944965 [Eupeodes corollae]
MDGYPSYRRRDVDYGGQSYELRLSNGVRVDIDNRWVVPYSPLAPLLCKTYKEHINVELCSLVKSIKYICKYVHKGSDKAIFAVQNVNDNDEITRYQMGRYISSNEAIWRIFTFPLHERDPAVIHLVVHLKTDSVFTLQKKLHYNSRQDAVGQFANTLMYTDVSKLFTWNKQSKNWEPRNRGIPVPGFADIFMTKTLGRLYTVHPKQREYAALSSSPQKIRQLFSIILTTCFSSDASALWNKYKGSMSEDILHRTRITNKNLNIEFSAEIYNESIIMIEDICILISNMPLIHFEMPAPNRPAVDIINSDVQREQEFDKTSLATFVAENEQLLAAEQRNVYDQINVLIAAQQGGFFFLDAPGGTGKTSLIAPILARIRSQNHIALVIASSGIAATLLDG